MTIKRTDLENIKERIDEISNLLAILLDFSENAETFNEKFIYTTSLTKILHNDSIEVRKDLGKICDLMP